MGQYIATSTDMECTRALISSVDVIEMVPRPFVVWQHPFGGLDFWTWLLVAAMNNFDPARVR